MDRMSARDMAFQKIVKGENPTVDQHGLPEPFKVLYLEFRALCIDIDLIELKEDKRWI